MLRFPFNSVVKSSSILFCIALLIVLTTLSVNAKVVTATPKQNIANSTYVVPSSNCYVTVYTLSKTKAATSKCLVPGKMINGKKVAVVSSAKVLPDTNTTSCYNPLTHLGIASTANGLVCFQGSGYLGIRLDGVYYLDAEFLLPSSGWVRYYNPGGNFFYFNWGSEYRCPWFCGKTEITQVNIY